MSIDTALTRRDFLAGAAAVGAAAVGASGSCALAGQPCPRRPRVAVIYTVCFYRSHAHHFLQSFLQPFLFSGKRLESGMDIVSLYADQRQQEGDMTEAIAKQYKIPVAKTIAEALTLGGKELAVDAVLSIGEHGQYPTNKIGQVEYPRKRFFDEITAAMQKANRFVPVFNDKHLSYRWDWARAMYDTARKLRVPLMAGSSVPLAQRMEALDLPENCMLDEAVSIHGGGPESYDFHAFEVLQSFAEFRKGGETGISSVEFLTGDALFKAAQERRWSLSLAEAAMRAEFGKNAPDLRRPIPREKPDTVHGILLTYRDGFRGVILRVGRSSTRWTFACQVAGERAPRATRFHSGPWGNRNLFMALCHAIQDFIRTGRAPYPVERTLLASGVCDALMQSRAQDGRRQQTRHLEIGYAPRDFRAFRETGASWKALDGVAEPRGFDPMLPRK